MRCTRSSFTTLLAVALAQSLSILCVNDAGAQMNTDPDFYYKAPSTIHGKTVVLPVGSHFEGTINDTISSTSRNGQRFSIEITSPVMSNSTDVIIPAGSKIIGEVVEALPSKAQRQVKGHYKKLGKLRTQLKTLVTPDGMTYPLFASIQAEYTSTGILGHLNPNRELGNPNVGYVGSQAGFSAVAPGVNNAKYPGRGPVVVDRREFLRDPIFGIDQLQSRLNSYGTPVIRSVQRKGNEIYIMAGSPLTIKLEGPLKMGIAPSKGALSIDLDPVTPALHSPNDGSFRRFQPVSTIPESQLQQQPPAQAPPPQELGPPDPDGDIPAFLRRPKKGFDPGAGGAFQPAPNAVQAPPQQNNVPVQQGTQTAPQSMQPPAGSYQQQSAPQQLPQGLQAKPGESF